MKPDRFRVYRWPSLVCKNCNVRDGYKASKMDDDYKAQLKKVWRKRWFDRNVNFHTNTIAGIKPDQCVEKGVPLVQRLLRGIKMNRNGLNYSCNNFAPWQCFNAIWSRYGYWINVKLDQFSFFPLSVPLDRIRRLVVKTSFRSGIRRLVSGRNLVISDRTYL